MDKINRIKELVNVLHKASIAYYRDDNPTMTDKQYDDLYDELESLEKETGVILAGSPTQKVQGYVLDGFKKVQHSKPMLSASKTKDIDEIKKFVSDKDFYCSYKLDGLTTVVKFENGRFMQGITRGTGEIGEDVTEQCKFIPNLPMLIPTNDYVELRGETVVSYDKFHRVNVDLNKPFSHPRNMAAGTLRNLDLNVVKQRKLSFIVFEVVIEAAVGLAVEFVEVPESSNVFELMLFVEVVTVFSDEDILFSPAAATNSITTVQIAITYENILDLSITKNIKKTSNYKLIDYMLGFTILFFFY